MLLMSKPHAGKLVNDPPLLKEAKKKLSAVVMLLVSKLPDDKLVKLPSRLKEEKKKSPGLVAESPKYPDKDGIRLIETLLAVVPAFGTRGFEILLNAHLVAPPARESVIV